MDIRGICRQVAASVLLAIVTISGVKASDADVLPTTEALHHALTTARANEYLVTLSEYYLYKAEDEPSVKVMLHSDDYDARMEALVNVMLSFQKSDLAKYIPANGQIVARYITPGLGQIFFTKEEVMKAGFKDIVAGNYRSSKAIAVLDTYRRFLEAGITAPILQQPAGRTEALTFLNLENCNLSWFLYALTKPKNETNACGGAGVSQNAKEIAVLAPLLSDAELPFSKSLRKNLADFAEFKYHFNPDLEGQAASNQIVALQKITINIGVSEHFMNKAIDQDGGMESWKDLSALDTQIASTDAAVASQTSVSEMRAMQSKKTELCQKRQSLFPGAAANKLCKS